jgi:hypothetical protein
MSFWEYRTCRHGITEGLDSHDCHKCLQMARDLGYDTSGGKTYIFVAGWVPPVPEPRVKKARRPKTTGKFETRDDLTAYVWSNHLGTMRSMADIARGAQVSASVVSSIINASEGKPSREECDELRVQLEGIRARG